MIPCSWRSRASAICFAIGNASSSGCAARDRAMIVTLDEFHHDAVRAGGSSTRRLSAMCDVQLRDRFASVQTGLKAASAANSSVGSWRDLAGPASCPFRNLPHPPFAISAVTS